MLRKPAIKIGTPKPSGPAPNHGITKPVINKMPLSSGLLPKLKRLLGLRIQRGTFKSAGVK